MAQTPSAAAQVIVSIIPIVGIVAGGTVVFFYLLWNHQQKMRLVEQGITPVSHFDLETFALLAGLLTFTVGMVLSLFFFLLEGCSYVLLGGLIPLATGTGLLLFYRIRKRRMWD
jgi:hypothetical protein